MNNEFLENKLIGTSLIDFFMNNKNYVASFKDYHEAKAEILFLSKNLKNMFKKFHIRANGHYVLSFSNDIILKYISNSISKEWTLFERKEIDKVTNPVLMKQKLDEIIPTFEKDLFEEYSNNEELHEGRVIELKLTKYERNRKARQKCLEHYGYKCCICGFDFKEKYGDDFEGIIQVHHIVPLSEIKQDYVVDPIKDLIPVCPNCHIAIHSKKDGYYTIEEIKNNIK